MLAAFLIATPLQAAKETGTAFDGQASPQNAQAQFWHFSNCVARTDEERVLTLLTHVEWTDKEQREAKQLALTKGQRCFGPLFQKTALSFKADLFHGALASYVLTHKYNHGNMPDFSALPYQFDDAYISRFTDRRAKLRALQMHVSECTFRNAPQETLGFLATQPVSESESEQLKALLPILSTCLQLAKDQKVTLSKTTLRSYLAQAVYAVELAQEKGAA
ncbi:hypothetical protein D6851_14140 [Altericroceibacterium spongiae]|uniref:Uncharacterized protein n=2 Tax=Altericroceibacterium spongiae TaxID=2320269 RepID=A0A420EE34_9SPHN|nr:hypothetical protein D6851_14140 [Altericroceibacterium spongiae]